MLKIIINSEKLRARKCQNYSLPFSALCFMVQVSLQQLNTVTNILPLTNSVPEMDGIH